MRRKPRGAHAVDRATHRRPVRVVRAAWFASYPRRVGKQPGRGGKIVHAVLDGSPGARAGIETRDIIFSIEGKPWDSIHHLVFSDRRPTEITAEVLVAKYFMLAKITVRIPPEPYRPIEDITTEAANVMAKRPTLDKTPYRNPRIDDMPELLARFSRRGRRR